MCLQLSVFASVSSKRGRALQRRLVVFLASISWSIVVGQGWQRISSPYPMSWNPIEDGLTESYFWSANRGFAGKWITLDGGSTWLEVALPEVRADRPVNTARKNFFATSESTHYFLGTTLTVTGPAYFEDWTYSASFKTWAFMDSTWRTDSSFDSQVFGCIGGDLLHFKNARQGYAFLGTRGCGEGPGDNFGTPYPVITMDSGKHWQSIYSSLSPDFSDGDFSNDSTFFFVSGVTLNRLQFSDTLKLERAATVPEGTTLLRCLNDSIFFAQTVTNFLRSSNQGVSWEIVVDSCIVSDVAMPSDSIIFIVLKKNGWSGIYKSTDWGVKWYPQLITKTTDFITITAASEAVVYAFGTNGIAYKTTDGGGTALSVPQKSTKIPLSVYPNPAITYTVIQGEFTEPSYLSIYDQLGREVYKQLAELPVSIPTKEFSSGCYTIRVGEQAAHFVIAK